MSQVPSSSLEHTNDIIVSELAAFKEEYGGLETTLQLTLQSTGSATADHLCISSADTHRLLNLLNILPHGPVKFSHAVPGDHALPGCIWRTCLRV